MKNEFHLDKHRCHGNRDGAHDESVQITGSSQVSSRMHQDQKYMSKKMPTRIWQLYTTLLV